MEQKEEQHLTSGEIGAIIQQLNKKTRMSNDVAALVRQDLEYGYTQEMVETYVNTGWKYERMKKFSEILGKTSDKEFISFIAENQFSERQMDTLLQSHLKQVPLEDMREAVSKGMTEYRTQKILNDIVKHYEEVRILGEKMEPDGTEDEQTKEIMGRIQELVSGVDDNKDFLHKVLMKLEQLDLIQKNGDEVKSSLSKTIEKQEALINEQQDRLNRQAKELVQKKNSCENLQKEKEKLESEYQTVCKTLEEVRKENTVMKEKAENHVVTEDRKKMSKAQQPVNLPNGMYNAQNLGQRVQVERTERRGGERFWALAGKRLFKGKGRNNLLFHLKNASLNPAQMQQIKVAIEKGISEEHVIDIINSGFDAQEMEQAIEIVLAEKKMYC